MKKLLSLILCLSVIAGLKAADANWKIHPIFDEEVTHVIETPSYVYLTSRNMMENGAADALFSLFRYDKKGDELMALSSSNILNGNTVRDVVYNPSKGYVAVLYKDYTIDLLHNDGSVSCIPYYGMSDVPYSMNVNSMTIDEGNDRLYLATDFGYVAINDKRNEVAESRIYGEPLKSICRMGDRYLMVKNNEVWSNPVDKPNLSLDSYKLETSLEGTIRFVLPLSDRLSIMVTGNKNLGSVRKLYFEGDELKDETLFTTKLYNIENHQDGLLLAGFDKFYKIDKEGNLSTLARPEEYLNMPGYSINMADVWIGQKRKGLTSIKKTGEEWSLTRDWMVPDAPATFVSTSFINHPDKGFLMLDYGCTPVTYKLSDSSPLELSGLRNGRWTNYAPAYTNPDRTSIVTASTGMALDPDNKNYVYISSYHNGFLRLNINDPKDILHFSHEKDADMGNDGFVILPKTGNYTILSEPRFDKKGNLWMYFRDREDAGDPKPNYFCWLAEDRKASTNAANAVLPYEVEFNEYFPLTNLPTSLPLLKTGNGLMVLSCEDFGTHLGILDYNGTPVDTGDDRVYKFPYFKDGDGNDVEVGRVNYIWEDPNTGYVWLCHNDGLCYFSPSQAVQGVYQLNRVKVPRNDGTNLADYLLDGVIVNEMTADGNGRKWFATMGGGVVCTSSDGREILYEFTSSNSPLPNDNVYGLGYDSATNSMMFSTEQGYAQFMLPASSGGSSKEDVKAYPNPVRPEYSGYVTITDIPQGSAVKIADAAGNLVKDLGVMSGFEILWDVSDSNYNRVKSGVYHILVSPSNENSKYSAVGKILVVS